jgi:hypothetical protein
LGTFGVRGGIGIELIAGEARILKEKRDFAATFGYEVHQNS